MTLFQFLADLNVVAASFFSPDDVYVAQLCGAIEAINAGITTVLDHFHLANSPEHIDMALKASDHVGIRSIFAMGTNQKANFPLAEKRSQGFCPNVGVSTKEVEFVHPFWQVEKFENILSERSVTSSCVSVGLALDRWKKMDELELKRFLSIARDHKAYPITLHLSNGVLNGKTDEPLLSKPLHLILGPDILLSHANLLTTQELNVAAMKGVKLSATPEVEHHLNMGTSILEKAKIHGCSTALGTDTTALVEGSFFGVMRASLAESRRTRNNQFSLENKFPRNLNPHTHEVFLRATVEGANVLGKSNGPSAVGKLEKGSRADIVLVDGKSPNMLGSLWPKRDVVSSIVLQASVADVKGVIIDGKVLKRDGRLVELSREACNTLDAIAKRTNLERRANESSYDILLRLAEASAKHIFEKCRSVDMDAVQKQLGGFLGVNKRLV